MSYVVINVIRKSDNELEFWGSYPAEEFSVAVYTVEEAKTPLTGRPIRESTCELTCARSERLRPMTNGKRPGCAWGTPTEADA
jgi:hypothetical protein